MSPFPALLSSHRTLLSHHKTPRAVCPWKTWSEPQSDPGLDVITCNGVCFITEECAWAILKWMTFMPHLLSKFFLDNESESIPVREGYVNVSSSLSLRTDCLPIIWALKTQPPFPPPHPGENQALARRTVLTPL